MHTCNAVITRRKQHRQSAQTHHHELLVTALAVLRRAGVRGVENVTLLVTVGQRMHQRRISLVGHGHQVLQKAFVDRVVRVQVIHGVEESLSVGSQSLTTNESHGKYLRVCTYLGFTFCILFNRYW